MILVITNHLYLRAGHHIQEVVWARTKSKISTLYGKC
jgi:hypothetical protein